MFLLLANPHSVNSLRDFTARLTAHPTRPFHFPHPPHLHHCTQVSLRLWSLSISLLVAERISRHSHQGFFRHLRSVKLNDLDNSLLSCRGTPGTVGKNLLDKHTLLKYNLTTVDNWWGASTRCAFYNSKKAAYSHGDVSYIPKYQLDMKMRVRRCLIQITERMTVSVCSKSPGEWSLIQAN